MTLPFLNPKTPKPYKTTMENYGTITHLYCYSWLVSHMELSEQVPGTPNFDDWSLIIIVPNVSNSHITLQALHIIYSHFGGYTWVYRIFMHEQKSKRIILLAHIFPFKWVYKPTYNWGPWPCIRLLLIYCTHHILIHGIVMNEFPYDMELWMNIWRFWNAHRTLILKIFKL